MVADAGLLDFNGTFIAELIAFILMILILGKYAYPRIMAAANAREARIEAGLRAAQEAEQRLQQVQDEVRKTLDEAKAQAREVLSRAHGDATVEAQEVLQRARDDAEAQIERARVEIGAERDKAIQDLRAEVSSLIIETSSKVVGESLDPQKHTRLINEGLNRVGGDGSASARN